MANKPLNFGTEIETKEVKAKFNSQATTSIQLRFYAGTFTGGPVQATALVRGIRIA